MRVGGFDCVSFTKEFFKSKLLELVGKGAGVNVVIHIEHKKNLFSLHPPEIQLSEQIFVKVVDGIFYEVVVRLEVAILLLIDGLPFPVKASSFQGGWDLEAVCRNESADKTISCKLHPRPSAKACLIFAYFYSSKASDLTICSDESPSRLTSGVIMDVMV